MADTTLPNTMRASQWTKISGGIEKSLKFTTTAPLPRNSNSLPKDSVLVKVAYASPNPVDYKIPESFLLSTLTMSKPAIPCGDFSGTVVRSNMPNLKAGDRVFGRTSNPGLGAFGEYVVLSDKEGLGILPDGVNFSDASTVGVAGLTAYQSLVPYVKPGSKVFINGGSGGTGTFGIQIAKILGCEVTTTCSGTNVDLCKSLGADEVIDYRTTNVIEHLKRQGKQYDLLIDNVNTPEIFWNAHHYLKMDGLYLTIAGSFTVPSILSMMQIVYLPSWLGGGQRKSKFLLRTSSAEGYAKIGQWMEQGKLKAVVEKVYELEDAGEAFARLKSGRTRGKLVVKVAGG